MSFLSLNLLQESSTGSPEAYRSVSMMSSMVRFGHLDFFLFDIFSWFLPPFPSFGDFQSCWGIEEVVSLLFAWRLTFIGRLFIQIRLFFSILEFSFQFVHAAKTLQKGSSVDPCTPYGYSRTSESEALSPGFMVERNRYLSTFHSKGNFSECRSVALMLLQKGKGCTNLHMVDFLKLVW